MRLQPTTPKAKVADFAATISDLEFTVEASVCPDDFFKHPRFRGPMVAAQAVGDVMADAFPVALKLTFHSWPTGDWQTALRAAVKQTCRTLKEKASQGEPVEDAVTSPEWRIQSERISERTPSVPKDGALPEEWAPRGEWDVCFRSSLRGRKDGERLEAVLEGDRPEQEVARVFAKLPDDAVDPYSVITKKADREARQLRGIAGPRVVMLDVTGVKSDVSELGRDQLLRSLTDLMRRTPEPAGVWLASRRFSTELRFQHQIGHVVNANSVC